MSDTARYLVASARSLLSEEAVTTEVWARAAAFIARDALEIAMEECLGPGSRRASFTSQLVCLPEVIDPQLARDAAWAWNQLSKATHAHGYAIPPTVGELERWILVVERMVALTPSSAS